jgi:hypothetical protein
MDKGVSVASGSFRQARSRREHGEDNIVDASGWSYYVPYREDFNAALNELHRTVFAKDEYWWPRGDEPLGDEGEGWLPRPLTLDELWDDDYVQEEGTDSILDVEKVIGPDATPEPGTAQIVSAAEARARVGTDVLTRAHVEAIRDLASRRGFGRCTVLHDNEGTPREIYFWGFSSDESDETGTGLPSDAAPIASDLA